MGWDGPGSKNSARPPLMQLLPGAGSGMGGGMELEPEPVRAGGTRLQLRQLMRLIEVGVCML